MSENNLLEVRNLKVQFTTPEGIVLAVDGITFDIKKGRTLAIVGESGCGKTVTALSLLKLLKTPPASISADSILLDGSDIHNLSPNQIRKIRGRDISMIFQEPMTSLNPVFRISEQMSEVYKTHTNLNNQQIREACIESLRNVGVPEPEKKFVSYPHELSGGLRQRVMIAMALSSKPKLLIADEPTTALDVTVQAQLLMLLRRMCQNSGMSVLLITHDFGVVADLAEDVVVMYAGKIVEFGPLNTVLYSPKHPYTRALINSIPGLHVKRGGRLNSITGMVPNLLRLPEGCRFAPRCSYANEKCLRYQPEMEQISEQGVACFKWRELN